MSSALTLLLVAAAGGTGSALRYVVDTAVGARLGTRRPWGLMVVNASGSFALGLLTGLDPGATWTLVLGVGLLGGYTTFSAASLATARLSLRHDDVAAVASSLGMLVVCVGAAALGHALA